MPEPEAETLPQPDVPKRSLLPRLLVAVVVLALAAGGGWWWHRARSAKKVAPASVVEKHKVTRVLHLESFVLNLEGDPEQKTFLRVGIDLGVEGDPKNSKEEEGNLPVALVRDTILEVLCAVRIEDVSTSEGRNQLKQHLVKALSERAPELGVREVYFTELLMQR